MIVFFHDSQLMIHLNCHQLCKFFDYRLSGLSVVDIPFPQVELRMIQEYFDDGKNKG